MKKISIAILIMILLMTSCGNGDFDVKGEIIEVNVDGNQIMVDSKSDDMPGLVWVDINEDAKFKAGVTSVFKVGNYVELTIEETVAQSYPPRAIAKKINVNRS